MDNQRPGLLRASYESARDIFISNSLFRWGTIMIVLVYASTYADLAEMGLGTLRPHADKHGLMILYLFSLPQQFAIYDTMLGVAQPKSTLLGQILDIRLLRCSLCFGLSLLAVLPLFVATGLASGFFAAWSEQDLGRMVFGVLASTALFGATLALAVRLMFFPIYVAQWRSNPVRASFRETRGKVMKIARYMFFPYLALFAVYILGAKVVKLPHGSGWWSTAAFSGASAAFVLAITYLETTCFVHVYQRVVRTPPDSEIGPPIDEDAFSRPPKSVEQAALGA